MEEKVEKIEKVGKLSEGGTNKIDEELDRQPPNREHFDSLVNNNPQASKGAVPEQIEAVSKNSLMDEVRNLNQNVDRFSRISPQELVAKSDEVIKQIAVVKDKLATPGLDLKPETQTLLNNKLLHIDENLRVAMSKAGLEYNPSDHLQNKSINPIQRFLGFLTSGQSQLASLSTELTNMHLNNKEISPANMLRIQMKVGYVSQEIEFFTAVLNKALDSTKTIMNVQV